MNLCTILNILFQISLKTVVIKYFKMLLLKFCFFMNAQIKTIIHDTCEDHCKLWLYFFLYSKQITRIKHRLTYVSKCFRKNYFCVIEIFY